MSDKERVALSNIQRALGMLEGISYTVSHNASSVMVDAVNIIEESLKEIFGDAGSVG